MAAEMEEQGADPDAVAAFLEASLDDGDEEPEEPLTLWPENAEAFGVFTHCKWDQETLSSMDGARVIYTGISSAEVHHACELLGVPREHWAAVLGQVRVAEAVALPLLNTRD